MKTALIVLLVLFVLGGLEAGNRYLAIRADLHAQREEAVEEWTHIGEALEQRAALISELASNWRILESAASASQNIADARRVLQSKGAPQEKLAANEQLSAVLSRLLADANHDPRLRVDISFSHWKDELAKCDNQVAIARNRYNKMLEKYNARISEFPDSLVASMAGFQRNDAYFLTADADGSDVRR